MESNYITAPFAHISERQATRASTDGQLLSLWLNRQNSPKARRAYERIATAFLVSIEGGLRAAKLDDIETFMGAYEAHSEASRRNALSTIKSLMSFAHDVGYTLFNVGKVARIPRGNDTRHARILSEADVVRLVDAADNPKHKLILRTLYNTGLRVSEIVEMKRENLIRQPRGVQISIVGKGNKLRHVLVPQAFGDELLALVTEIEAYVFQGSNGGAMHVNSIDYIVKSCARRAGFSRRVSPHWLRHSHISHAIDRNCPLTLVRANAGHASLSTTSAYAHARPDDGSAFYLGAV